MKNEESKLPRDNMPQASNPSEAHRPRQEHSPGNVRQDSQNLRADRAESKEKDTRELILKVAERLFRQMGFQKTTVADIARETHMSPANV